MKKDIKKTENRTNEEETRYWYLHGCWVIYVTKTKPHAQEGAGDLDRAGCWLASN